MEPAINAFRLTHFATGKVITCENIFLTLPPSALCKKRPFFEENYLTSVLI